MSYQEMLFTFLGGLGIFLFGIKYLGDGLQKPPEIDYEKS